MGERYIFKQVRDDIDIDDIPNNLTLTYEFDGDCHVSKVLAGFKDFLRGCGFGESLIDRIIMEE